MTIVDFLLGGDPSVKRLTQVYLLEQAAPYEDMKYEKEGFNCVER